MTPLWTCHPSTLPPHNGKKSLLPGPLFDLSGLQQRLQTGTLDLSKDEHFCVATDDCWNDIKALKWKPGMQLKQALLLLKPGSRRLKLGDYLNSQWAEDSDGGWCACDAYEICIDEKNGFVRSQGAPATYIKFSLDEHGCLYFLLISCHAST